MFGRLRLLRFGLLIALLALAVQLAVGATVMRPLAGVDFGAICRGHTPNGAPDNHAPLPAQVALCAAMAVPAPLIAPPEAVVRPTLVFFPFAAPPPPATGPPVRFVSAARPRGPPVSPV